MMFYGNGFEKDAKDYVNAAFCRIKAGLEEMSIEDAMIKQNPIAGNWAKEEKPRLIDLEKDISAFNNTIKTLSKIQSFVEALKEIDNISATLPAAEVIVKEIKKYCKKNKLKFNLNAISAKKHTNTSICVFYHNKYIFTAWIDSQLFPKHIVFQYSEV